MGLHRDKPLSLSLRLGPGLLRRNSWLRILRASRRLLSPWIWRVLRTFLLCPPAVIRLSGAARLVPKRTRRRVPVPSRSANLELIWSRHALVPGGTRASLSLIALRANFGGHRPPLQ